MSTGPSPKQMQEAAEFADFLAGYGQLAPVFLRDFFAGAALIGLFAQQAHPSETAATSSCYGALARDAYLMADAMIVARNGGAK